MKYYEYAFIFCNIDSEMNGFKNNGFFYYNKMIIKYWRHFFVTYKGKWTESRKLCISSKIWWDISDIGGKGDKPYFWYW